MLNLLQICRRFRPRARVGAAPPENFPEGEQYARTREAQPDLKSKGWISNLPHRPCATNRLLAVCLVTGNQPVAKGVTNRYPLLGENQFRESPDLASSKTGSKLRQSPMICRGPARPPCRGDASAQHRPARMDASLRAHGVVVTRPGPVPVAAPGLVAPAPRARGRCQIKVEIFPP